MYDISEIAKLIRKKLEGSIDSRELAVLEDWAKKMKDLTLTRRQYSDASWKQMDPQIPKSNWWFPEAPFVGIRLVRPLNPPSEQEIEAYYNEEPIKDY